MTPKKRMNILLADDGSAHAQAAMELLESLPLPPKTRILAYRAFNSAQIPLIPEIERSLENTRARLSSLGYLPETEMQLTSPAEGILERARERKPDLIVLGARGLRSTASILLGGVAQQVVEYACCPVLIVRAPFKGLHQILLVTDGSPSSRSATQYLTRFPLPDKTTLSLMHVLPPVPSPVLVEPYLGAWQTVYATYPTGEEETALRNQEKKAGQALLERTCKQLQRHGIDATTVLARGDAATEIIEYVRQNHVDLIVAGSRGLSQFKSLWVGSVSRKLVHYSDCSILVVKAPKKE